MARGTIASHISQFPGRHLQEGARARAGRARHHPVRRRLFADVAGRRGAAALRVEGRHADRAAQHAGFTSISIPARRRRAISPSSIGRRATGKACRFRGSAGGSAARRSTTPTSIRKVRAVVRRRARQARSDVAHGRRSTRPKFRTCRRKPRDAREADRMSRWLARRSPALALPSGAARAQTHRATSPAIPGPIAPSGSSTGAKKEGEVTLYSSAVIADTNAITSAFEKKYGIKVKLWRGSSEDILRRAVTEHRGRTLRRRCGRNRRARHGRSGARAAAADRSPRRSSPT